AVAHRPAKKRPRGHCAEKSKKVKFRAANGHMKLVHQIKRVIRAETRQIEKFREHQRRQNQQRPYNLFSRQMRVRLSLPRSDVAGRDVRSERYGSQLRLGGSALLGPG